MTPTKLMIQIIGTSESPAEPLALIGALTGMLDLILEEMGLEIIENPDGAGYVLAERKSE